MQRELNDTTSRETISSVPTSQQTSLQDGFSHPRPDGSFHHHHHHHHQAVSGLSCASSSGSASVSAQLGGARALDAERLDEQLRHLITQNQDRRFAPSVAGQRVSEYENASSTPSKSKQTPASRSTRQDYSPSQGIQLAELPNETLTHILSHLHPDSHAAMALVSKRFYALVTTPHAWQMAFLRHFPGQKISGPPTLPVVSPAPEVLGRIRSEYRPFTRLTALASWRSEYLLRTRLLRSAARGKPGGAAGGIGAAARVGLQKRASAVLTYNSKLPWMVSTVHAIFSSSAKKAPKAIHGSADLCVATLGDPTSGKIERWGLDDPFSFSQLDEVFPNLEPYGVGPGPAATLNVMDASVPYGIIGGEGFPGGRPYLRPTGQSTGRYLGVQHSSSSVPDNVPRIPEMLEGICSVWIAKSSAVPSATSSMAGIMTGSTLGVVTSYSLGYDSSGPRYEMGDMTCRWVLSPGVPIIALRVDDNYSPKRESLRRVWAVALNALGEVFYLTETPTPPTARPKLEYVTSRAWETGQSVSWKLIERTRRKATTDEPSRENVLSNGTPGHTPPTTRTSPGAETGFAAERLEIESNFRKTPSEIKKSWQGWDMRRKLEVDFGADDGNRAGEAVVVITCGLEADHPAALQRFTRRWHQRWAEPVGPDPKACEDQAPEQPLKHVSIFGSPATGSRANERKAVAALQITPPSAEAAKEAASPPVSLEDWSVTPFSLESLGNGNVEITSSAIDSSLYAVTTLFEEKTIPTASSVPIDGDEPSTATEKGSMSEIPGRRARMLAVGTGTGSVVVWNVRESSSASLSPQRFIQTESPEVSSLALSSLYLVHGGSDGLAQAWDVLASSVEPVRTLNSRASGRLPRAILNANPMLRDANHSAVGAIYLDPDPALLRGVLAFGTFLRYWTYNSGGAQGSGRKRRSRQNADACSRLGSRRIGGTVMDYIAHEAAELRREKEHNAREEARLRSRFGVGLGDLTEEEAIRYAQMISEESFQLDEETRRSSGSDDTVSVSQSSMSLSTSFPDVDTSAATPPPSNRARSTSATHGGSPWTNAMLAHRRAEEDADDPEYERQMQQAMRLSLLEAGGVNDEGVSPCDSSSGEYEFQIRYKPGRKDKPGVARRPSGASRLSSSGQGQPSAAVPSASMGNRHPRGSQDYDEDLQLALRLSLQEAEAASAAVSTGGHGAESSWPRTAASGGGPAHVAEDFPALETKGKGKGKGKSRIM